MRSAGCKRSSTRAAAWAIPLCALWVGAVWGDPLCDPGGPYESCIGNCPSPTQFDGSGSSSPGGKIVLYQWDFGDGGTATGATPEHQYNNLGDFTVTLTVTDDRHGVSSCTTLAHVYCTFDVYPLCEIEPYYIETQVGVDVIFDGSNSSGVCREIVWYEWDFGDGTSATGVKVTHRYEEPGFFAVTLVVWDEDAWTSTCSVDVDVRSPNPVEPATWGRIKSRYH